jgi:hypothetical protein
MFVLEWVNGWSECYNVVKVSGGRAEGVIGDEDGRDLVWA